MRNLPRRASLALILALLGACTASTSDAPPSGAAPAANRTARVDAARVDAARGAERLVWGGRQAVARLEPGLVDARALPPALALVARQLGVAPAALSGASIAVVHEAPRIGRVLAVEQRQGELPIVGAGLRLLFDPSGALVATTGHLAPSLAPSSRPTTLGVEAALARACAEAGLSVDARDVKKTGMRRGAFDDYEAPRSTGLTGPLRARPVAVETPRGLERAFEVEVFGRDREGYEVARRVVVSAADGVVVDNQSLLHNEAFTYRVWADSAGDHRPADGPTADVTPNPNGSGGPAPAFVAPTLVTLDGFNTFQDPWLPAGATVTTGNNVDAYTDDDVNDGFSAGDVRATVTAPNTFDFAYDLAAAPQASDTQRKAGVTAAFYTTNWLHDHWYDAGFDEAAGNAQSDNYGRGGASGDPLHVETQNGAPQLLDNANMMTPSDGMSPRMQIFLWSASTSSSFVANGQAYALLRAEFGATSASVAAPLVLGVDATAPTADGCSALTNNVSGKILLVERGQCSFKQKAVNAEAAGALGVVIANNQPGPPQQMGDGNPPGPVAIPVISITQVDGATLEQALAGGPVNATLDITAGPLRDGALDAAIVAHEWGHYLHQRLVLGSSVQYAGESEGWGDFTSLQMIVRAGDDLDGTYSASVYASSAFADAPYAGLRRYPYSTQLDKNPLTFRMISDAEALPASPVPSPTGGSNSEVHNVGEVWASMMFEGFVAMLKASAAPNPPYSFDEARRRMSEYVVAGMKLAPQSPTFTEQRDAVLAAAFAASPEDGLLLAQGFAKRGAGTCAVSPDRFSNNLDGVVESFELSSVPRVSGLTVVTDNACDDDAYLDPGETGQLAVVVANDGPNPLQGASLDISSSSAAIVPATGLSVPTLAPFGSVVVNVPLTIDGALTPSSIATFHATLSAPSGCVTQADAEIAVPVAADEVPSTSDDVEPLSTTWQSTGDEGDAIWARVDVGAGDHAWRGIDSNHNTDSALVSAPIAVTSGAALVLSFDHRYDFELGMMGERYDGGVVEVSTDDGATWVDAATLGAVPYDGAIDTTSNNPLGGSDGFTGQNASYPARDHVSLDLGTSLGGQTVRVRFRIGTDDAAAATGWDIDNVSVSGTDNQPFLALGPNDCASTGTGGAGGGAANGGAGPGSGAGSSTGGAASGGGGNGGGANPDDDGCGCRVADERSGSDRIVALLALVGLGATRRRRAMRSA